MPGILARLIPAFLRPLKAVPGRPYAQLTRALNVYHYTSEPCATAITKSKTLVGKAGQNGVAVYMTTKEPGIHLQPEIDLLLPLEKRKEYTTHVVKFDTDHLPAGTPVKVLPSGVVVISTEKIDLGQTPNVKAAVFMKDEADKFKPD